MKTEIGNDKKPPLKTNKILLLKAAIFLLIGQRTLERNTLIIFRYYCLVMSENYIRNHFTNIKRYANIIELP